MSRRNPLSVAAATLALVSGVLMASPPGAVADPTPADLQTRVDTLLHEAEVASEQYNQARVQLAAAQQRLASLQEDLDNQKEAFNEARTQIASLVVAGYEGQTVSTTAQVLFSDNPDDVLSQLAVVLDYSDDQSSQMRTFVAKAHQLALREQAAKQQLQTIADTEQQLKQDKATLDAKVAAAQQLLAQATAAPPRQVPVSRSTFRVPADVPATGRAKIAIDFALAQVGKSYVYGAAGPDSWDCSGLTMVAWGKAGVSLPHSAGMQYSYGRHVSASQLQPGDLVFYYTPISHVGIYLGHGMIVNAANPRTGVTVVPVFSMPFVGATRLG